MPLFLPGPGPLEQTPRPADVLASAPSLAQFSAGSLAKFQPDPFGATAFFTPPLIPSTRVATSQGNGPVFPVAPYGAAAFLTYSTPPYRLLFGQRGNGPVFPPDAYGAQARFTPPLIPTVITAGSAGNRAVFALDSYGAAAFMVGQFIPPVVPKWMLAAGSDFRGVSDYGFNAIFNPVGDGSAPPAAPNPGGGGFGALMSDEHFHRYQPRYAPRPYESRYKPTIRTQKKG